MARKTEEIYRDACRRSHRVLATYLALYAWTRRLDGLCIERDDLLEYLGLSRMEDKRVEWLKDDINPLFPHVEVYRYKEYYSVKKGTFDRLFIARRPFPSSVPIVTVDVLRK